MPNFGHTTSVVEFTTKKRLRELASAEVTSIGTPPTGYGHIYAKTDGNLYWKNDTGIEFSIAYDILTLTTVTNPANSDAVAGTALVDAYAGIIVLNNDGSPPAVTISNPTATTQVGRTYTVVNDDSSTDNLTVNSIIIVPGDSQRYIWDGSVWIQVTSIDANDITFNPASVYLTDVNVQSAFNSLVVATAGTVEASKALVVDASRDIGTIHNIVGDGTFDQTIATTTAGGERGINLAITHDTNELTGELIGGRFNARADIDSLASGVVSGLVAKAGNTTVGYDLFMARGIYAEVVNKTPSGASTWTYARAFEANMDLNQGSAGNVTTFTNAALFYGIYNLPTVGTYTTVTNGYGIFIRNEQVGGNGQMLDAGFYLDDLNMGGGVKGWDYGIDFNAIEAGFGTADLRLNYGATINNSAANVITIANATTWDFGAAVAVDFDSASTFTANNGLFLFTSTAGLQANIIGIGATPIAGNHLELPTAGVASWNNTDKLTHSANKLTWSGFIANDFGAVATLSFSPAAGSQVTIKNNSLAGSNIQGTDLIIQAGEGTGNADVGQIILSTPKVQGAGSGVQTASALMTLDESLVTIDGSLDVGGSISVAELDLTPAADNDAIDVTGTNMTTAAVLDANLAAMISGQVIDLDLGTSTIQADADIIRIVDARNHDDGATDAYRGVTVEMSGNWPGANASTTYLINAEYSGTINNAAILYGVRSDISGTLTGGTYAAGYYTDGTRIVIISDGTDALNITGNIEIATNGVIAWNATDKLTHSANTMTVSGFTTWDFGAVATVDYTGAVNIGVGGTAYTIEADNDVLFANKVGIGVTPTNHLHIADISTSVIIGLDNYSANAGHQGELIFRKSSGTTIGTPATTVDDEDLGQIAFMGTNANATPAFAEAAKILVEQTGAAGDPNVGAEIQFWTGTNTAANAVAVTIASDKSMDVVGALTAATIASDDWIAVSATKIIYLDGGGDTYIHEQSADDFEIVVGGNVLAKFEDGVLITVGDGTTNGSLAGDWDAVGAFSAGSGAFDGSISVGTTLNPTRSIEVNRAFTGTTGSNLGHLRLRGTITEAASGTHGVIAGIQIDNFTVTDGGGTEAVINLAGLYILDAPTQGTAPTNGPYQIFCDGTIASRFDGDIGLSGNRVPVVYATDLNASNDLLMATAGEINWNSTDKLAHSANTMTVSGFTTWDFGAVATIDFNAIAVSVTGLSSLDVNASFTASTLTSDAGVSGTTITASVGFALGNGDYIGITGNEIITFNTAGTIIFSGATFGDGTAALDGSGAWSGATYNGLSITAAANTFLLAQGTASLDVAAAIDVDFDKNLTVSGAFGTVLQSNGQENTLLLNENLTVGDGFNFTLLSEDTANSITLDKANFEVEGEQTAAQLMKLVNSLNEAATLIIEGTSGAIDQDVRVAASPQFVDLTLAGAMKYGAAGSLTISAGGAVAITKSYHTIVVNGGTGSGNDDLSTATGGAEGDLLILKSSTSGGADTVTVKDGAGADTFILAGGADFIMDHIDDRLILIHNATEWVEMSRSANS